MCGEWPCPNSVAHLDVEAWSQARAKENSSWWMSKGSVASSHVLILPTEQKLLCNLVSFLQADPKQNRQSCLLMCPSVKWVMLKLRWCTLQKGLETAYAAAASFHSVSSGQKLKSQCYQLYFRVNNLQHFLQEVQIFSLIYLVLVKI